MGTNGLTGYCNRSYFPILPVLMKLYLRLKGIFFVFWCCSVVFKSLVVLFLLDFYHVLFLMFKFLFYYFSDDVASGFTSPLTSLSILFFIRFIRLYLYLRDLSSRASMLIVCIHSLVWKCFCLLGYGWYGCWFIWELLRFYHGNKAVPFRKQKHQIFCIKWNLFTFSKRQFLCLLLLYTTHYAL